jgi:hypothetical protein
MNVFRKILTQRNYGPRQEFATSRKMPRCARVARCKGNFVKKYSTRGNTKQETQKGQTEENRCWKSPECRKGIKDPTWNGIEGWSPGERAPLGSGGTRKKDIYEIFREKIMEHVDGTCSWLQKMRKWSSWRGQPLPKRKKKKH